MAFHLDPLKCMRFSGFNDRFPQIPVLHWLFIRFLPPIELPVPNPYLIECIDDQSTITVNFYMARYFQCFQPLHHSLHLHPVIGRQLFPSRKFLPPFSTHQEHSPSARTEIGRASCRESVAVLE